MVELIMICFRKEIGGVEIGWEFNDYILYI